MSSDEAAIAAAEADLQQSCRDICTQLDSLQVKLSTANTKSLASSSQSHNQAAVLQEKERLLKAHIEQLNHGISDTSDVLPSDSPVLHALLSEELKTDEEQLRQTLSMLRSQRSELQQQIESETELKREFEHLRSLFEEQLANTENVPRPQVSSSQALATATVKCSQLKQQYKTRLDQMVTFVRKYFPPLSDDDVKQWQKMHSKSARRIDASSFLSLEIILESLMNKSLETPNEPYIDIDDTLWPPYVEMLLRSGIVLHHPRDVNRIRLTPYHY